MIGGIAVGVAETAADTHDGIFDVTLPQQPYPGLRPFEKDEWPIFFGREIVTGQVVERLIDKQFLVLHGDFGCGKSSLIRAGVMPRLERDHARGGATWRTSNMLPRNTPLRNFATALAALDATPPDPARVTVLRRTLNLGTKAAPHLSSSCGAATTITSAFWSTNLRKSSISLKRAASARFNSSSTCWSACNNPAHRG